MTKVPLMSGTGHCPATCLSVTPREQSLSSLPQIKWVVDRLNVWLLLSKIEGRLTKEGEATPCWTKKKKKVTDRLWASLDSAAVISQPWHVIQGMCDCRRARRLAAFEINDSAFLEFELETWHILKTAEERFFFSLLAPLGDLKWMLMFSKSSC